MPDVTLSDVAGAERIAIVGCPGSGKTWLARRMAAATGLPHYCLDDYYWGARWQRPSHEAWMARIDRLVSSDRWIIDGNHFSTMRLRVRAAQLVIFLDLPTSTCLSGIFKRFATQLWRPERALPLSIHRNLRLWDRLYLDPGLVRFVWRFRSLVRPQVLSELALLGAATRVVILRTRAGEGAFPPT